MDTDDLTVSGRRVLSVFIRVYPWLKKKFKKKKVAFPGRTWQIDPVKRMSKKLRFGLPKGSLQEATIQKMAKAGYNISVGSRSYVPYVDDDEMEIRLIRAQEISRYVEHGYLDCGITGRDWIVENSSKGHEVGEFLFSKI